MATQTHLPPETIKAILAGKGVITPEIAAHFSRVLGSSAQFWLKSEARYRAYLEYRRQQGPFRNALRAIGLLLADLEYRAKRVFRR